MTNVETTIGKARSPRRRLTSAERRLWTCLRDRRFRGLVFQRQALIGTYVVDFYCPSAQLVIELDDDAHVNAGLADESRDSFMDEQGITVVRFANSDVMHTLGVILDSIYELTQSRLY